MKYYLLLLVSLHFTNLHGQSRQDYIWLFGVDEETFPGETGYIFDFSAPPMKVQEHDNNIGIGQANTSICDKDGNLLMYMNGCAVMNRNFEMMENGDSLSYDIWWEVLNKDCRRMYNGTQDNIILIDPGSDDRYYVIHKPRIFNGLNVRDTRELWYSIVDMSENNGQRNIFNKPKFHQQKLILI